MIQQQSKQLLKKYTTAAKHIIFDGNRMKQFAKMMDTRDGAVKAVQSIMAVIEQTKPIPPEIKTLLGVNIYIIMIDLLQEVHKQAPDNKVVAQTALSIIKTIAESSQKSQPMPQQPPVQQPPTGLMGGMQP